MQVRVRPVPLSMHESLSGWQDSPGMLNVSPTLGRMVTSAIMFRRAMSQAPRLVARATSKTVVFSLVISYVDVVVFRALELQAVAKLKLAEERNARSVNGMPLIVAE